MSGKGKSKDKIPAREAGGDLVRRSGQALAIAIAATVACLAADLGSKEWASANLSVEHPGTPPPVCETPGRNQRLRTEPLVLVEGYLELSYAENCGAAFGLLNNAPDALRRGLFGVAAIAAAFILFWMFFQGRGGPWFAYSVPLIVSGAVGNFVDRIRLGYVVDFIRFHIQSSWEYPTFNVADITITVGVVMLIIDGFVQERAQKRARTLKAEDASEGDDSSDDSRDDSDDAPTPSGKGKKKRKKKRPAAEEAAAES